MKAKRILSMGYNRHVITSLGPPVEPGIEIVYKLQPWKRLSQDLEVLSFYKTIVPFIIAMVFLRAYIL